VIKSCTELGAAITRAVEQSAPITEVNLAVVVNQMGTIITPALAQ
jgi:hypothetical protein